MKIKELSIGDWVVVKLTKWDYDNPEETEPMRIRCIDNSDRKRAYADLEFGSGQYSTSAHIEDLRPIPLTPEILEKNGINKTYEGDEYAVYKGEDFSVTVYDYYTELWELSLRRNRVMLKNVHQLQHAFRLFGVEKEIEV